MVTLLHGHGKEDQTTQTEFALLLVDRLDHPEPGPTDTSSPFDTPCANPTTLVLTDETMIRGTVTEAGENIIFRAERPKVAPLTTLSGMLLGRHPTRVSPQVLANESVSRRHLVALPPPCSDFLLWRTPPPARLLTLEKPRFKAENGFTLCPNYRAEKRKRVNDETFCVIKKVKPKPHDIFPPRTMGTASTRSRSSEGIINSNPFSARSFS